eukprot:ANDGO_02517.mRNA.1 hypothetical protein
MRLGQYFTPPKEVLDSPYPIASLLKSPVHTKPVYNSPHQIRLVSYSYFELLSFRVLDNALEYILEYELWSYTHSVTFLPSDVMYSAILKKVKLKSLVDLAWYDLCKASDHYSRQMHQYDHADMDVQAEAEAVAADERYQSGINNDGHHHHRHSSHNDRSHSNASVDRDWAMFISDLCKNRLDFGVLALVGLARYSIFLHSDLSKKDSTSLRMILFDVFPHYFQHLSPTKNSPQKLASPNRLVFQTPPIQQYSTDLAGNASSSSANMNKQKKIFNPGDPKSPQTPGPSPSPGLGSGSSPAVRGVITSPREPSSDWKSLDVFLPIHIFGNVYPFGIVFENYKLQELMTVLCRMPGDWLGDLSAYCASQLNVQKEVSMSQFTCLLASFLTSSTFSSRYHISTSVEQSVLAVLDLAAPLKRPAVAQRSAASVPVPQPISLPISSQSKAAAPTQALVHSQPPLKTVPLEQLLDVKHFQTPLASQHPVFTEADGVVLPSYDTDVLFHNLEAMIHRQVTQFRASVHKYVRIMRDRASEFQKLKEQQDMEDALLKILENAKYKVDLIMLTTESRAEFEMEQMERRRKILQSSLQTLETRQDGVQDDTADETTAPQTQQQQQQQQQPATKSGDSSSGGIGRGGTADWEDSPNLRKSAALNRARQASLTRSTLPLQ